MNGTPGDERKHEILAAVAALLDGLDQAESLPEGLSPAFVAPDTDLAGAVRALTVEAGEIAADRRARAALVDTVTTQARALEEVRAELVLLRQARATEVRDARDEAEAASLLVLLDLRDRLERVVRDARLRLDRAAEPAPPPAEGIRSTATGWLARLKALLPSARDPAAAAEREREVLRLVVDGVALIRDRLDETLDRAGVLELAALGLPFEPSRMFAVGAVRVAGAEDGTVAEVEQAGYERGGRVLRPARVRVARAVTPAGADARQAERPPAVEPDVSAGRDAPPARREGGTV
jgi:molecular chaperone GrpE (heat shock protein)